MRPHRQPPSYGAGIKPPSEPVSPRGLLYRHECYLPPSAAYPVQGTIHVLDQIVRILDADGETDEPVSDAKGATSLGWERSMARHGRIEGEAVHVAHGRRRGDEFEGVQEAKDLSLARAHDLEAQDGAIPTAL